MMTNFMENVTADKSWIKLVANDGDDDFVRTFTMQHHINNIHDIYCNIHDIPTSCKISIGTTRHS